MTVFVALFLPAGDQERAHRGDGARLEVALVLGQVLRRRPTVSRWQHPERQQSFTFSDHHCSLLHVLPLVVDDEIPPRFSSPESLATLVSPGKDRRSRSEEVNGS
jgi:hypothetical protein